jgi:protein-S-isoprenylcysteine O-methyltransferase Ste14
MNRKALSINGYLFMAGGCLGLILSRSFLSSSPIVIAIQLAAVALMIWARFIFGRRSFHATANPTEGGLVTRGPYRFIRHPIYTAVCLFFFAGISDHFSFRSAILGLLIFAGAFVRMLAEEHLLVEKYPSYLDYAQSTKRMIPFLF